MLRAKWMWLSACKIMMTAIMLVEKSSRAYWRTIGCACGVCAGNCEEGLKKKLKDAGTSVTRCKRNGVWAKGRMTLYAAVEDHRIVSIVVKIKFSIRWMK